MTKEEPGEPKLQSLLQGYYRDTLGRPDWREVTERRIKSRPVQAIVARLNLYVPLAGKTVLDVGCGFGDLLLEANTLGANVFGIDPDYDWIVTGNAWLTSKRVPAALGIAVGEALPFRNDCFDVIISNQVLEHVRNPLSIICEMARVLKPGGACYINFPNYLLPIELHYRVPWIPFLPKTLGKAYLAILGRNSTYLDEIHYTTAVQVLRMLRRVGLTIEVNLIHEMIEHPSLLASKLYRTLAKILKAVRVPPHVIMLLTPTVSLILRKPG